MRFLGVYLSDIIITVFVYQKGTGKWTAISALEYGMPVTLIGEFYVLKFCCMYLM